MDPLPPDEVVETSDPAGLVPAAIRYEGKALCDTQCAAVPPIPRRRVGSRSGYRSGVVQDGPLPGTLPGRDFVTGVALPSSLEVRLGF